MKLAGANGDRTLGLRERHNAGYLALALCVVEFRSHSDQGTAVFGLSLASIPSGSSAKLRGAPVVTIAGASRFWRPAEGDEALIP